MWRAEAASLVPFPRTCGGDPLFFEIINQRYIQQERTIISSEWTLEQILDFDEACGSRIAELCADYIISISPDRAKNFRLR